VQAVLQNGDDAPFEIFEPVQREFGLRDGELLDIPVGRLLGRLERIHERWKVEAERESKEFVVSQLMNARSVFFGLQNTQDLPTLPSEQKKKPQEGKIKKARDQMQAAQEAYMKAISHPYWFEEYNGLGHVYDPPTEPEERDSQEFREQRKQEAAAREQRFASALRAAAEASGNALPEEG
jgi:hypothetical protein